MATSMMCLREDASLMVVSEQSCVEEVLRAARVGASGSEF